MKLKKVINYKEIAKEIEIATGMNVSVKIMKGKDHFHFGLTDENELPIGIVCYDEGKLSFAPFRKLDDNINDAEYINFVYAPLTNAFLKTFKALSDLVLNAEEYPNEN